MQHFTRNTVEASEWCPRCYRNTMHRIDGVKLGPCLECLNRPAAPAPKPEPEQFDLFAPAKVLPKSPV